RAVLCAVRLRRAPHCPLFPYTTLFRSGARGVGVVGRMDFAARQVPQKEGVDRAEQELARLRAAAREGHVVEDPADLGGGKIGVRDRKSTRLNSSHVSISYAVFCLKKKS